MGFYATDHLRAFYLGNYQWFNYFELIKVMLLSKFWHVLLFLVYPTNTRRCTNAGLMLVHRLRRWSNTKPALGERRAYVYRVEFV